MAKRDHLPLFGVGPLYVLCVVLLTVAAVLMRNMSFLASGKVGSFKVPMLVLGIILIVLGAFLWVMAAIVSKIDANIVKNQLVTSGAYSWVRNPIYSAFMIISTGIVLILGNLWFLVVPVLDWVFMTVLMKFTEEKWLLKQYGKDYEEYCSRVYRCWPWFPGKH